MMLKNIRWVAVAAALALVSVPVGARAELKPPVVAVVDAPYLVHESSAGKGVQKVLEGQGEAFHREISSQEDKLRQTQQELERQHGTLSEDAFNKKRRDFEKQVADFQRETQARQKSLQQGEAEAQRAIVGAINEIIVGLAREKGINIVLQRPAALFVDSDLDVTQDVLERLNRKLPAVVVNFPPLKK